MIRRDATPEEVDRAADAVEAYVKDRPASRDQLGRSRGRSSRAGSSRLRHSPRPGATSDLGRDVRQGARRERPPLAPEADRDGDRTAMTALLLAASLALGLEPAASRSTSTPR